MKIESQSLEQRKNYIAESCFTANFYAGILGGLSLVIAFLMALSRELQFANFMVMVVFPVLGFALLRGYIIETKITNTSSILRWQLSSCVNLSGCFAVVFLVVVNPDPNRLNSVAIGILPFIWMLVMCITSYRTAKICQKISRLHLPT